MSRWKVMACALTLSLGGVAYVAGPMNNRLNAQFQNSTRPTPQTTEPAPAGTTSNRLAGAPTAAETIPPELLPQLKEANGPAPIAIEFDFPVATNERNFETGPEMLPTPREIPTRIAPPMLVIEDVVPVQNTVPVTPPISFVDPGTVPLAPPTVSPVVPMTGQPFAPPPAVPPVAPSQPQPQPLPVPETPMPTEPAPRSGSPLVPPSDLPRDPPPVHTLPEHNQQIAPASVSPTKLRMLMRLGDGRPRFEIREQDSAELLFKVYGEKVEMQQAPQGMKNSPIAGVTASGKVRFVGPGIEGTCDQLSVLSGTGEVLLKGNVSLKTKKGKTWSEMTAEKMIYQIGTNGLTTASSGGVRPASYNSGNR